MEKRRLKKTVTAIVGHFSLNGKAPTKNALFVRILQTQILSHMKQGQKIRIPCKTSTRHSSALSGRRYQGLKSHFLPDTTRIFANFCKLTTLSA